MPRSGAKLTGSKELSQLLKNITKKTIAMNRQAINKATSPIVSAAKQNVPVDHGDLKRSMTKKVYNRGEVAVGIVGADSGYVASAATGERIVVPIKLGVYNIIKIYDLIVDSYQLAHSVPLLVVMDCYRSCYRRSVTVGNKCSIYVICSFRAAAFICSMAS